MVDDVLPTLARAPSHDHAVSFYERDPDAVEAIAEYVVEGLRCGESVVVVATEAHRTAVDDALRGRGVDPLTARTTGRYVTQDAAETMSTFMVGGSPDRVRFMATVGSMLDRVAARGSDVRAFGEMVALLWDEGNVTAALELESLWNDLAHTHEFSLLCAYPTSVLDNGRLGEVREVCALHSAVRAPQDYGVPPTPSGTVESAQSCQVFLPVPQAVAAARQFASSVLHGWGYDALAVDACLVMSELATNAVVHAGSPFRAFIHRTPGALLIAVKDAGGGTAKFPVGTATGPGGRGLGIVEILADRWGCDALPDGKVVWAEFALDAVPVATL